jgi:hypothetical protein
MRTKVHTHTLVWHPEAQDALEALVKEERRLSVAKAGRPGAGEVDEALADVRARMAELRETIDADRVNITFRGLSRRELRRLLDAHPPRDGDALDKSLGYNGDSFLDAYVAAHIVKAETLSGEPVEVDWSAWADDMTNGQFEDIRKVCLELTNGGEPVFPQ